MNDRNSLLVAYADGELAPELVEGIERLIAADPEALRMVEMYRETAAQLRAACGEEFYTRDIAIPSAASRPWARPRLRHAMALAASLALAVIGFGGGAMWAGASQSARDEYLAEVAEYHEIYARETRHLVEVPAEQGEHLRAWLGHRLDRNLDVPDLAAAGLRFAGGRMLVINGRPVAQLMYTREQGLPVAICLTQMTGTPSPISVERHGALRLASWQDGAYGYVVVGDIDTAAAWDIAERAKLQLRS